MCSSKPKGLENNIATDTDTSYFGLKNSVSIYSCYFLSSEYLDNSIATVIGTSLVTKPTLLRFILTIF